uniref:Uncharacterized protein n=1 Tax=Oryza sativa subsp. japonica TaxID=39947 RepID=Q84NU7_ORYSJ|nr:hypothetical protein [Oryza sativa Japonica Group]BAD30555.1 hypothetical protein [Oryza sativa Japonica Group]
MEDGKSVLPPARLRPRSNTVPIPTNQNRSTQAAHDSSENKCRCVTDEQLSTRVGYGRVHSIIENILDKCGVIAPNLPTKTDDLSHSTGHRWTTREKDVAISHTTASIGAREIILLARWFSNRGRVTTTAWSSTNDVASLPLLPLQVVELRLLSSPRPATYRFSHHFHFKWSSYDYCLVLDQRHSVSPTTSTSSGRVTTTALSSTSDVASLPLLPLQVVELRLLPGPRPAIDFSYYLYFNKVDSRPPRNLRDLRLGTPRTDKALSDPVEKKDHVRSGRAGQGSKSLILRERFSDDKAGG